MRGMLKFLLCAVLGACTVETEEGPEPVTEVVEEEVESGAGSREDTGGNGCDLYGTVSHELNGVVIPVPTLCNPYYFDKGDPDPTQNKIPGDDVALPAEHFMQEA